MEKLDKEALGLKIYPEDWREDSGCNYPQQEWDVNKQQRIDFIKGLEYVENHYLKLIEEKDKEYDALESMWLAEKGINKLIQQQLKIAKEIEDSLKQ